MKQEKINTNNEQNTNNKKSYPRSGSYNPEDVSIEKFFYAGMLSKIFKFVKEERND